MYGVIVFTIVFIARSFIYISNILYIVFVRKKWITIFDKTIAQISFETLVYRVYSVVLTILHLNIMQDLHVLYTLYNITYILYMRMCILQAETI